MYEKAIELLTALGLADADEDPVLPIIRDAVTESLQNKTNQTKLPKELTMTGAYRIAGQYLQLQKKSGRLTKLNGADLESSAIKQIQEGDTNVVFGIQFTAYERHGGGYRDIRRSAVCNCSVDGAENQKNGKVRLRILPGLTFLPCGRQRYGNTV